MRTRGLSLIVCGVLAAGLSWAGCGGGDDEATTTETGSETAAATSANEVRIADFKYDPETVTVPAGTELTWANDDSAPHTATADDSSFDTGDLDQGDSASVVLKESGTFTYYCRFHPFMKGTVEVE